MSPEKKNMLRGVALAILIGVAVYTVVLQVATPPRRDGPFVGQPAPTFSLPRLTGEGAVDLTALRGKGVVLAFWATWCDSCQHELPILERLHRQLAGEDLVILTIAGQPRDELAPFVKARGWTMPVLVDGGQVHREYRVDGIPYTVFIGPDGTVLSDSVGPLSSEDLAAGARRLVACAAAQRSGKAGEAWCRAPVRGATPTGT